MSDHAHFAHGTFDPSRLPSAVSPACDGSPNTVTAKKKQKQDWVRGRDISCSIKYSIMNL